MKSWTDVTFKLGPQDQPCVSSHTDAVSLHQAGYSLQGRGFALTLTRHHLAVVRKLLDRLEALPPLPSESDANPFD